MILTRICSPALVVLFTFLSVSLPAVSGAPDQPAGMRVQQTWQLLDYVATDYPGAVRGHEVIDPSEYAEQIEFTRTVEANLQQLPADPALADLRKRARALVQAVEAKAASREVAGKAHALADALLQAYPVPSAPTAAPDVARGAALYGQQCAACHGRTGDGHGPAAAHLDPPPIAFTDAARADRRSPLSLYQVITQGVEGTAMASYADSLSDAERWDLAYYVGTLAYPQAADQGAKDWHDNAAIRARISSLGELSHARVAQLSPSFGVATSRAVIGWLRAHPDAVGQAPQGIALARARLSASLQAYRDGRTGEAVQLALSAYLDGVEPVEPRLDARDRGLRSRIETAMGAYRTQVSGHAAMDEVQSRYATADGLLVRAQEQLQEGSESWVPTFAGAFTIVVREGLEALLVVVALLAFLRRAERPRLARPVHLGWVLALVAGGITWAVARYFISISGASRELTEGLSSLFAAAVLLSVGLWMHQKSIGGRWQAYLKQKMDAALQRRSAWFLFGLAFLTVYREVFETILFYAALWGDGHHLSMLGGLAAGAVVLALIAWVMLKTSRRLPLGRFFSASSALIAVLAVVLAGKGVAALQEAGWMGVNVVAAPRIEWLGIYPTRESLLVQLAVVVVLVVGYVVNVRRGRHLQVSETT